MTYTFMTKTQEMLELQRLVVQTKDRGLSVLYWIVLGEAIGVLWHCQEWREEE